MLAASVDPLLRAGKWLFFNGVCCGVEGRDERGCVHFRERLSGGEQGEVKGGGEWRV